MDIFWDDTNFFMRCTLQNFLSAICHLTWDFDFQDCNITFFYSFRNFIFPFTFHSDHFILSKNYCNHKNRILITISFVMKALEYLQITKTLKKTFFSWSEFCYWTKLNVKCFFNKNNAFKRDKAFFCFFRFLALTFLKSNSILFHFSLKWRY